MKAVFLDIETTGLDATQHCPLELAFCIYDLMAKQKRVICSEVIALSKADWDKSDQESLKVNGFTWEKVLKGKPLGEVKKQVVQFFQQEDIQRGKAFFICQNPSFDRAFFHHILPVYEQEAMQLPYHWLDLASMYYATRLNEGGAFPLSLSKDSIAAHYGLPAEERPHSALNGVMHLIDCYLKVIKSLPPERGGSS